MGYTKLFQKLLSSSIWNEDLVTKVVWITMLALKDHDQMVLGSVGGVAHQARVPIEDCRRALAKLMAPDPDDSSKVEDGRRLLEVPGGWFVVNGEAYRDSKDDDERRGYMAKYMREYRAKRKQNVNNGKHLLAPVNTAEQNRTEQKTSGGMGRGGVQGRGQDDEEFRLSAAEPAGSNHTSKRKKGPMMSATALKDLQSNPAYKGIDVVKEAWKFKTWCETKKKPQSVARFVGWLNRIT